MRRYVYLTVIFFLSFSKLETNRLSLKVFERLPSAVVNLPGKYIVSSLRILNPSEAIAFYRNIPV